MTTAAIPSSAMRKVKSSSECNASLWLKELPYRIALDAQLHSWRALGVLLLGGIALVACGGAAIYDALAGEPHRDSLYRNPVTEWIIGPAAISMFGVESGGKR